MAACWRNDNQMMDETMSYGGDGVDKTKKDSDDDNNIEAFDEMKGTSTEYIIRIS